MVRTVLIRTTSRPLVAATFALLAACEPDLPPVQVGQPIPPGPAPGELADYATAQMQYRLGLAAGNGDAVKKANETFYQIPREISPGRTRDCSRRKLHASQQHAHPAAMSEHQMAVQRSNEGHSAGRGGADRSCQFRDYRASGRRTPLKGRGAADRAANLLIRKRCRR
jgi:hypothetical protein